MDGILCRCASCQRDSLLELAASGTTSRLTLPSGRLWTSIVTLRQHWVSSTCAPNKSEWWCQQEWTCLTCCRCRFCLALMPRCDYCGGTRFWGYSETAWHHHRTSIARLPTPPKSLSLSAPLSTTNMDAAHSSTATTFTAFHPLSAPLSTTTMAVATTSNPAFSILPLPLVAVQEIQKPSWPIEDPHIESSTVHIYWYQHREQTTPPTCVLMVGSRVVRLRGRAFIRSTLVLDAISSSSILGKPCGPIRWCLSTHGIWQPLDLASSSSPSSVHSEEPKDKKQSLPVGGRSRRASLRSRLANPHISVTATSARTQHTSSDIKDKQDHWILVHPLLPRMITATRTTRRKSKAAATRWMHGLWYAIVCTEATSAVSSACSVGLPDHRFRVCSPLKSKDDDVVVNEPPLKRVRFAAQLVSSSNLYPTTDPNERSSEDWQGDEDEDKKDREEREDREIKDSADYGGHDEFEYNDVIGESDDYNADRIENDDHYDENPAREDGALYDDDTLSTTTQAASLTSPTLSPQTIRYESFEEQRWRSYRSDPTSTTLTSVHSDNDSISFLRF